MKWRVLFCSILQVSAISALNLCVNCKFFRPGFLPDKKFGQCSKFPRQGDIAEFLVTGKTTPQCPDYYYCETARSFETMCGKKGVLFEQN